jgi:hypothetical protein
MTLSLGTEAQIADAYRRMAIGGRYRPCAPSDGHGTITAPLEDLDLDAEAAEYARRWWEEEDQGIFYVGCCDWETRPATIFAIEAARLMCSGYLALPAALRLLHIAVADIERDPELETAE